MQSYGRFLLILANILFFALSLYDKWRFFTTVNFYPS